MQPMVYGRFLGRTFGVIGFALMVATGSGCGGSVSGSGSSAANQGVGTATTTGTGSTSSTTGTATISWSPPTENTDGTPVAALSGYRVYYGTSADALTKSVDVSGASVTSYEITNLSAGTYYFAVAALTTSGAESALSETASKAI